MTDSKWTVEYGIHRGTLISRDNGEPKKFDTKNEAETWIKEERAWLRSIGYMFWYVYLRSPSGEKTLIEQNPYR